MIERLRALGTPPAELVDRAKAFYRRQRKLDALIQRLAEDPALRAKAQVKPDAVLRQAGLEAAPELVALIREDGRRRADDPERRLAARRLWP